MRLTYHTQGFPYLDQLSTKSNSFSIEEEVEKYESLLYKIGFSFQFNDRETFNLVQQVFVVAYKEYSFTQPITLRIYLAKHMVRACIRKLSDELFSQAYPGDGIRNGNLFMRNLNLATEDWTSMPLIIRTVHILDQVVGFNEREIAEILNTTISRIRERQYQAKLFCKSMR